ncbi:DAK2 domain-containing protein [Rhodococcoides yunnanense]|uniref:DAK2 domain-containing protein n=1 Tax=Rhodococcoides yunnanense TaxID=278209 RepID=UPI0009321FA8
MGPAVLGVEELRAWAYRCVDDLTARCDEINELNVFPIADSDTGTNLVFTVRSAVESMRAAGPEADLGTAATALSRGAVAGARGNSGVIVSQVLRAVGEVAVSEGLNGAALIDALLRAADLVVEVVSIPVQGTIVSVLARVAEDVSALDQSSDVGAVARCAAESAARALDRTRRQLPALEAAGVVDAGALGLLVMLDALSSVLTGDSPSRRRYHRQVDSPARRIAGEHGSRSARTAPPHDAALGYEVLYGISGIDDDGAARLRRELSVIGDSVVVAGDGNGSWSAHVHTANAGLAVDVGLEVGTVHGVRIAAFGSGDGCGSGAPTEDTSESPGGRDILAVVAGDGAELLYVEEGAIVLRSDTATVGPADLCAAIVGSGHPEVLVLPNGALSAQELVQVSIASRDAGKEVLMLPSGSMVQGLAALAVHDPSRVALDDAFAMSEAAAGTRWASLRIAEERSLTWVGTCEPGDGLGLVGREVVVIGPDGLSAGCSLLDQLLSVGGEMVTLLLGEAAPAELGDRLVHHVRGRYPGVEVVVYTGGQPGDLAELGVE